LKTDGLGQIADATREYLEAKHRAREHALAMTREVIRLSANAIRNVHRKNFEAADGLLEKARSNLDATREGLAKHPAIFHAGFVHDAQKEFAEAHCTRALISGGTPPSPDDLGIMATAYLNGIGETVGELRRHLLDTLRAGDINRCEEALAAMGDIYDVLVTMDYPEAVTGGLRRTADAMRGILERTRGDFSMAYVQRRLEDRLREFEERLPHDA
jgi:translin